MLKLAFGHCETVRREASGTGSDWRSGGLNVVVDVVLAGVPVEWVCVRAGNSDSRER